MIDLTPLDVTKKKGDFRRAVRGYDTAAVDDFLDTVAARMGELVRENQLASARLESMTESIGNYRERERAMNEALVSAQQLREEMREQATREADLVLREARAEAERLVEATKGEIRRLQEEVVALERSRRAYLSQMRQLVERQLAGLEAAEGAPPALPGAGGAAEGGRQPQATPAWLDSLMKE